MKKYYGYARVSSKDQNEARQIYAFEQFGIEKKNIFLDKETGSTFNRSEYKKLLLKLEKGDVLAIKSIDRLGRNYKEIINQWWYITNTIGADLVVLDMELLDTRRKDDDILSFFVSNMVLQTLSCVAELERENTRQRQQEGIYLAKLRGVKFGRPAKKIPENFEQINNMYNAGNITSREAAKLLFVSQATFLRWSKKKVDF